jgi:phospholipid/cholesterol/gamma-HCH transport system substrate-binding protein
MAELTKLTGALQKNQERISASLETTANAVSDLTVKVNENQGTIGRLVNDPKLYDNLANTTARLDTLMYRINNAEGSLGLLVNDTSLYNDLSNLLVRASNLIADIQARPRDYFKFSVF